MNGAPRHLRVEIVTPRGLGLERGGVERVVLRRTEPGFAAGSQLVVLPRHGDMLVRIPAHDVELACEEGTEWVRVGDGVAEVHEATVTILTDTCVPATRH